MSVEKQIEEMAKIIGSAIEFDRLDFCMEGKTEIIAEKAAKAFYNANYRKQSEGEWEFEVKHFFDDYGDLTVYATAHCSECKKDYPFNPTISREYITRPDDLIGYAYWDVDVEPIKAEVVRNAKANKSLYPFCPNCGAEMKGGAE